MKQQCENAISAGALGVKIICSGRLAGSEMARKETQKLGSIPLHTLDANVDYATATGRTTYGAIGVKVWIYRGKFGEEPEPNPNRRRRPRREGGGGGGRGSGPARRGGEPKATATPAPAPENTPASAPESSPNTES
jgi:small subunit ribosomal protein S3